MKVILNCSLKTEAGGELLPPGTAVDLKKELAEALLEKGLAQPEKSEAKPAPKGDKAAGGR